MDEVIETTNEAAEDVNVFIQYLQDHIPNLISFAIEIVLALIFFFLGRIAIKWIRKLTRKMLERSNVDKGVETFVDSLLKFMLYGILLFTIATKFGFDTASVAALIASAGVAVGLAVQGSLSNFAGGILILLLKPFVVGDYIIEDNHGDEGTVKEIQLFYTKLLTVDNRTVVIPNGMLTNNSLTNVTHMDERKLELKISISYESDLLKAKAVLADLIRKESRIMQDKEHRIFVDELGDDGVILGMRCWVSTEDYWNVRWDMLEGIKLTFDRENIVIPYRQMNVRIQESN
ncbi:mechanosensitive ion channel family protein [Dorea sp. AF36-15AT]|jgi:small conductance mechanosensitive channel|uniref:mechanosensitive ion channel family protein n=1 Tax=Dorea sp. AF36-15AT TaxID=2292041 RepID=UPI000E54E62A|nr:mechanosensitive ion channel domain-containing protein [Dorea sp. AF36-15AT]RHP11088.1 mechanosensitive ion channel family protein [Dorea sp. AF36-15AT]